MDNKAKQAYQAYQQACEQALEQACPAYQQACEQARVVVRGLKEVDMVTELVTLSASELKELQKKWYQGAVRDGSLGRCYKVCVILGERIEARHGHKYGFKDGGLDLYVDNWGNFFTARWEGKQVMSTHPCTKLFIPGAWMDKVNLLYPLAVEKEGKEKEAREDRERQQLLEELSLWY